MKRPIVAIVLMLAAMVGCITPFDAELHEGLPSNPPALAAAAPSIAYELIVIAPSDSVGRLNGPDLFGERVGRELDQIIREHGIRPTRLDTTPVPGNWLRLTLTRGRQQIRLKAERWDGDRLVSTEEQATRVQQVRSDVALLLDRLLTR
jgi:hypothetical protein